MWRGLVAFDAQTFDDTVNQFVTVRIRSMGQGNVFTGICQICPQGGGCTRWMHLPPPDATLMKEPALMHPLGGTELDIPPGCHSLWIHPPWMRAPSDATQMDASPLGAPPGCNARLIHPRCNPDGCTPLDANPDGCTPSQKYALPEVCSHHPWKTDGQQAGGTHPTGMHTCFTFSPTDGTPDHYFYLRND